MVQSKYLVALKRFTCLENYLKGFLRESKAKAAYILACSLEAMHSVGVIHCDLHTGNVLVFEYICYFTSNDDGSKWIEYPIISDFGLVRPLNCNKDGMTLWELKHDFIFATCRLLKTMPLAHLDQDIKI
ncbi:8183_t:CDS:2 [Acaulospora morrowiae]|uniref:8183_t:CDS:1 n=1 Tax=Acaulospora morrowiae TaxID=94023 RepID=A0A9N9G709_9GLOM|nr:8183_t:CDS:2 [Acaulospora morrowiae]